MLKGKRDSRKLFFAYQNEKFNFTSSEGLFICLKLPILSLLQVEGSVVDLGKHLNKLLNQETLPHLKLKSELTIKPSENPFQSNKIHQLPQ